MPQRRSIRVRTGVQADIGVKRRPDQLQHLQRRAEEVGGFFTVQDTPERGTRLRWSAATP
jgi:Cu/Ag efflux pump CusA